jgi:hypothetical protein
MSGANIVDRITLVDRINAAWRKAATAYIDIGNMLIEAKDAVKHGEWIDLLGKLDFDKRTAQKLMEIARDERLAKASALTLLPQHWTTLYALTRLGDDEFERALSVGGVTKQTKPRAPTVTEAEYHDVTQSPDPHPGAAVSAEGESTPPHAPTLIATPQDDAKAETGVVIPDDGLQGHYQDSVAAHEALALADSPVTVDWDDSDMPQAVPRPFRTVREGRVAVWIDPNNPMSVFATGLMLAMDGAATLAVAEAAVEWPENMALLTDRLHEFIDRLIEFEAAFRAQHGNGNTAANGTDESRALPL